MSQLSVSFNVRDGGRALVPRMVLSVARQNTPGCRLDLDNLNEIWGQSRFRWNAILSSWHSNELKTARLSIPYYPLILLYSLIFTLPLLFPPPPPPRPLLFAGRDFTCARVFRLFYSRLLPRISPFPFLFPSRERKERDLGTTLPEENKEILAVRSLGNRQPQS